MDSKICTKCKQEKKLTEFTKSRKGFVSECKPCRVQISLDYRKRNREKVNEYRRKWRKENSERISEQNKKQGINIKNHYKHAYGLTLEQVDELHESNNYTCCICGKKPKKLYVDHCHKTGEIRGSLCQKCNTGIGMLGDDYESVKKAVDYLARSERKEV